MPMTNPLRVLWNIFRRGLSKVLHKPWELLKRVPRDLVRFLAFLAAVGKMLLSKIGGGS